MTLASSEPDLKNSRFIEILNLLDRSWSALDQNEKYEFQGRLKACYDALIVVSHAKSVREDASEPTFELSDEEKKRLVQLCSEMRNIVHTSSVLTENHRVRLLKRIAAIEQEIHKLKGRFDVILAGVSDIGEAAGKFGNDVKPLVDRMKEIVGLTRKKTPDYAQLPAPEDVKKLPPPSEEE